MATRLFVQLHAQNMEQLRKADAAAAEEENKEEEENANLHLFDLPATSKTCNFDPA